MAMTTSRGGPFTAAPRRGISAPFFSLAFIALFLCSSNSASAQTTTTTTASVVTSPTGAPKTLPPADGSFVLGAWLNWDEYPQYLDTPAKFNSRLGYRAGSFQVRQSIPPIVDNGVNVTVNVSDTWDDNTDAFVLMTIYADQSRNGLQGLDLVTTDELQQLAVQLQKIITDTGRAVILRYLPEMNGDWMLYGVQPARYVANWISMATVMRQLAPSVKLLWSPNFDLNSRGDNAGGQPYWPGPQYVDFVGTSQYWKASQSVITNGGAFQGNYPVPAQYFVNSIMYVYNNYAAPYNKPFVLSEASAAWEIPENGAAPPDQVTQAELQREFWSQVFQTFSSGTYPLFWLAYIFEYDKPEDGFDRDFRVTYSEPVRKGFISALQPLIDSKRIAWATVSARTTSSTLSTSSSMPTLSNKAAPQSASSTTTSSAATLAPAPIFQLFVLLSTLPLLFLLLI
ncbi:glycoside hydrolase superfamily [Zopfochytrium polystomum]|nr:glycoside hydrolase superfamily [Zopfochytrium polystomum]